MNPDQTLQDEGWTPAVPIWDWQECQNYVFWRADITETLTLCMEIQHVWARARREWTEQHGYRGS